MGEDESLDGGEPVEDEPAGGVGGVQVGEGGEYGAGGGDGVAVFGEQAGQRGVGAERGAQVGFDESVDEQGPTTATRAWMRSSLCRKTGRTCRVCLRSRWRCSTIHWSL